MTCHLFLTNYGCCAVKECPSKHTTRPFCAFASPKQPPFIMLMLRRSLASVSHILLLTAVSRSTLSHLLFHLMAILDITAVASHLRRLLVFVPLSGREFLWPWLIDFCPQKQHTVVVCSFSLQCTSWPPFKSLPVRQKQLVFSLFNNKFLTVEIVDPICDKITELFPGDQIVFATHVGFMFFRLCHWFRT